MSYLGDMKPQAHEDDPSSDKSPEAKSASSSQKPHESSRNPGSQKPATPNPEVVITSDDRTQLVVPDNSDVNGEEENGKFLEEPRYWSAFDGRLAVILGAVQIAIAVGTVVLQIAGVGRQEVRDGAKTENEIFHWSAGWGPAVLLVTGGIGIGAGKKKTTWLIVCALVSSATAAGCAVAMAGLAGHGVQLERYNSETAPPTTANPKDWKVSLALAAILVVFGASQIAICVWMIVISAQALCCNSKQGAQKYKTYHYKPGRRAGAVLVACGVVCMCCNIIALLRQAWRRDTYEEELWYTVPGITASLFYLSAGSLAIRAKEDPSTWILVSSFVLSIFSIASSIYSLIISAFIVDKESSLSNEDVVTIVAASIQLVFSVVGMFTAIPLILSLCILCGARRNTVFPLGDTGDITAGKRCQRRDKGRSVSKPEQPQSRTAPLYLDVGMLPGDQAQSAPGLAPQAQLLPGQQIYLRQHGPPGTAPVVEAHRIHKPIILGYQHAMVQQVLIPMQSLARDTLSMRLGPTSGTAPPIGVTSQPQSDLPHDEELGPSTSKSTKDSTSKKKKHKSSKRTGAVASDTAFRVSSLIGEDEDDDQIETIF